jgi:hypothetical protein
LNFPNSNEQKSTLKAEIASMMCIRKFFKYEIYIYSTQIKSTSTSYNPKEHRIKVKLEVVAGRRVLSANTIKGQHGNTDRLSTSLTHITHNYQSLQQTGVNRAIHSPPRPVARNIPAGSCKRIITNLKQAKFAPEKFQSAQS